MPKIFDKPEADNEALAVGSNALFDMENVKQLSPRLKVITEAIEKHDIQTHHAPHCEEDPWMAIPMNLAREKFAAYKDPECAWKDCASITASIARLLDDCGMIFYGQSEDEVIYAAMDYVESNAKLNRRQN